MRWILRGLVKLVMALATLALIIAGLVTFAAFQALPETSGTLKAAGLAAPVIITRDERGVPWIEAQSADDAYMALGYVHAQDRLFQMELMRRLGQGRLAEILGPLGVRSDKFMRTLGLYKITTESLPGLDAETLAAAKAYAQGVNAFLADRNNALPIEFKLLFIKPEPWQIADSLVWQKLMGLQLSGNWPEELERAELIAKLGAERAKDLWPDAGAKSPVTIAALPLQFITNLRAAMLDVVRPSLASNIWAVAPNRTATGGAFLANDPHLNFQAPNMWYLAGLSYPGVDLIGATVPGVPFHLLGHNGHVAWGFTTTHGDTQDLFIETVSGNGERYQTPDGWLPFEVREEMITVRFRDPEIIKVRTTRHGPVISDILPDQKLGVVALSATLLAPDDHSSDAIFRMARAQTTDAFLNEARRFHAPQQNIMFADTNGNIGYIAAGRVPLRQNNTCNGLMPVDGATGICDWMGWADFDALPQSLNPDVGLLINANNKVVADDYPIMIAKEWHEGYRAQRIEEFLAGRAGLTLQDMSALQRDHVSLMAREILPLLVDRLTPTERKDSVIAQLTAWDGTMSRERIEPLVFALWMERLKWRLLADDLGDQMDQFWGARPTLIRTILSEKTSWCDDIGTSALETCETQVAAAWQETQTWLEENSGPDPKQWIWGEWHIARFDHPVFGNVPGLSWLGGFATPTDGDDYTVNRGSFSSSTSAIPFRHRHGAGFRAIYDLSDLSRSQFSLAGGQSGHLMGPHRDDLLSDWAESRLFPLTRPSKSSQDSQSLTLTP